MRVKPKDILFFVGAGVSKVSPSRVPLGYDLTKFIMQEACGINETECIFNLWKDFSNAITQYDDDLKFSIIRLETVLGCIQEIDQLNKRKSILYGLKSFSNIPYNMNHRILAAFLSQGSNIITTNFDLGIENAYEANYDELKYNTLNGCSEFSCNNSGSIYHIHGCSNDSIEKLGATVKIVKQGFNDKTKALLEKTIKNSKVIVFLGYSVSDSFDITPYFEEIKYSIDQAVFVQHKLPNEKNEYPKNLSRIVKNIKNLNSIIFDTTDYLEKLSKEVLNIDPKSLTYDNNQVDFDWKEQFVKFWDNQYNSDEKLLNLLGIRFQIGFNTCVLESVRPDIILEIKEYQKRYNHSHNEFDKYFSEALRSFDTLNDEKIIKPKDIISGVEKYIYKDYLIKLTNECKYYYLKYKDVYTKVEQNDLKRINELIRMLELFSQYSFDKVQYISYISASLKYLALFKSRFHMSDVSNVCRKELLLSLDISYIEGSIAALTHYAEHCINLREINGDLRHDSQINQALTTAYKLSKIAGYYYHCIIIESIIKDHKLNPNVVLN